MITIPQPALALNSTDFPPQSHYRMQYNEIVSHSHDMTWIKTKILEYASRAPRGILQGLIINAHGWCADGVDIGTGLNQASLAILNASDALRGKIREIYLCSCEVADTTGGQEFCRQLAYQLHTYVVASETEQTVGSVDRVFDRSLCPVHYFTTFRNFK